MNIYIYFGNNSDHANHHKAPNTYSNFHNHKFAHNYFTDNFVNNAQYGHACLICDRL